MVIMIVSEIAVGLYRFSLNVWALRIERGQDKQSKLSEIFSSQLCLVATAFFKLL